MADNAISVASVIEAGVKLASARVALFEQIDANRKLARLLVIGGQASKDEAAQVEKLYPTRERKAKAEQGA